MSSPEELIENNYIQAVRRLGNSVEQSNRLVGEFRKVTKLMDRVAKSNDPKLKALNEIIRVNSEKARAHFRDRIKVLSKSSLEITIHAA